MCIKILQINIFTKKIVGNKCCTTSSGVISVGGFNVGFACCGCSSGNLPLPITSPFFGSCTTGTASNFYIFEMCNGFVFFSHKHKFKKKMYTMVLRVEDYL